MCGWVVKEPPVVDRRKTNWFKKHRVLTDVTILAIVFVGGAAVGESRVTPTKAVSVKNMIVAPESASAMTHTTQTPHVLLNRTGFGEAQTAAFITTTNWSVTYIFNCSTLGSPGNFLMYVDNTNGTANHDAGISSLALYGGETTHYHDSGEHYLRINSECSWTIKVVNN
jgi:hypothetical protein